ncbi:hypothetical protein ACO0RG_002367 [Hanseniaspora osmophila]
MRDYKLVVLGAGGVGKSCLTVQFVQGVYIDVYDPTIEDSYTKTMDIDGKLVELEILDTAGVQQFTAMRELYIKSGHGFLLVYSVDDENSLSELLKLRDQVLRIKDTEKVPMVLVGNKADLSDMERKISVEDGITVSEQWGKIPFYETSALLRSNVDEVFVDLVRQIIRNEIEEQKRQHQEQQQEQQQQKQAYPKHQIAQNRGHAHSNSTVGSSAHKKTTQLQTGSNGSTSSFNNKPYSAGRYASQDDLGGSRPPSSRTRELSSVSGAVPAGNAKFKQQELPKQSAPGRKVTEQTSKQRSSSKFTKSAAQTKSSSTLKKNKSKNGCVIL